MMKKSKGFSLGKEILTKSEFYNRVLEDILEKVGSFPRSLFSKELYENYGLTTENEQIDFAKYLISDSKNKLGRVLILKRDSKDRLMSPAIQIARGRGNPLKESYLPPHAEHPLTKFESLTIIEGAATLIIFDENGNPKRFIKLGKSPYFFGGGVFHSLIYQSPIVVLFENKGPVLEKPTNPKWVIAEGNPKASVFLDKLHSAAKSLNL